MKRFALILVLAAGNALPVCAQNLGWPDPLQQQTYTPHRAFSTDPTGANHDFRIVAPGAACGLSGFVGRQKGETTAVARGEASAATGCCSGPS